MHGATVKKEAALRGTKFQNRFLSRFQNAGPDSQVRDPQIVLHARVLIAKHDPDQLPGRERNRGVGDIEPHVFRRHHNRAHAIGG